MRQLGVYHPLCVITKKGEYTRIFLYVNYITKAFYYAQSSIKERGVKDDTLNLNGLLKDGIMSVLSNTTIKECINNGRIIIEPKPSFEATDNCPFDPCSVQLHIGDKLQIPRDDLKLAFDLSLPKGKLTETLDMISETITIPKSGYILEPGKFCLAQTLERVSFPRLEGNTFQSAKALAGRIEGRSSFARTGLFVHFTAPTIHFEFDGTITLELLNHGPMPLVLRPKLAICQLIVETVRGLPDAEGSGQFQNQNTPSGTVDPKSK